MAIELSDVRRLTEAGRLGRRAVRVAWSYDMCTEPIVVHQRAHNTTILVLIVMSRISLQALHEGSTVIASNYTTDHKRNDSFSVNIDRAIRTVPIST
eukprot:SAG25_NODE_1216_length_3588_cov_3.421324_2_plen_97_part_00